MRTRTATFSHPNHWEPPKESIEEEEVVSDIPRVRHKTFSEESRRPQRRTFSFGGGGFGRHSSK